MDYLWELRRRQQAALNRLLTGSPSKEETTAEEEVLRRAESLLRVVDVQGLAAEMVARRGSPVQRRNRES